MARGKIFTNRKKIVQLGDDKLKQSSKSKKDKKSAEQKSDKKVAATDVFDYRTGVVYSIRPEDTDVQLMEAKVTSYLKDKGAIEDPKEYLTTAVHLGDPNFQASPSEETPPPALQPSKQTKPKMEKSEVPVSFWREVKDAKTNNSYYWNPDTNVTSWTLPENAVITSEASERSDRITDPEDEKEVVPDLVKAYNHCAKTLFGINTDEIKGNGIAEQSNIESHSDQKTKKGKQTSEELSNKPHSSKTVNSPATAEAESPLFKLQVSNLSDDVSRKLDYLHVSRERITDLQKLQIQLETRMEDWKDEQLSSKYFVSKLKSASEQVNTFVQGEVPSGWTCVWDRQSCRYYFNNSLSGKTSWEFPTANADSVILHSASGDEDDKCEQPVLVAPSIPPLAPPTIVEPPISNGCSPGVVQNMEEDMDIDGTDDSSSTKTTEEKTETVLKSDIAKADRPPPMQLYDDIGPLTDTTTPPACDYSHLVETPPTNPSHPLRPALEAALQEEQQNLPEVTTESRVSMEMDSDPEPVKAQSDVEGNKEDGADEEEVIDKSHKKLKKRSRYHSDSDGESSRRKSSSKRSRRHHNDSSDYSDNSDDYYSKSSRRRSCSKDRSYRSDSEERYSRKSRKYGGRDDSDSEQQHSSSRRSSRKHKSRSRSRDHGTRDASRKDSKKKKKEKKKHKHRDSSSGDEFSHKSKGKQRDRDYNFSGSKSNRESLPKDPPPIEKKAFVPAKFKPKPKIVDDNMTAPSQIQYPHVVLGGAWGEVPQTNEVVPPMIGSVTTPFTPQIPVEVPVTPQISVDVPQAPIKVPTTVSDSAPLPATTNTPEAKTMPVAQADVVVSDTSVVPTPDTPTLQQVEDDTTTVTVPTEETVSIVTPASQQSIVPGDITPPAIQEPSTTGSQAVAASSATYSNAPTSYAYDQTQQAAYAAAYAQQYYSNPYQYYTDPTQYAAAMNYYAAYQAAYTGSYGAYYQQQTPGVQTPSSTSNGGTAQK